jgi:hypothetical protein
MKRFLCDHWPLVILASVICGYLFVTSGLVGLGLANYAGYDHRTSLPGVFDKTIAFILGGVILSGIRLLLPLALLAGEFVHGTYALVQLPLVLGVVVVAVACMVASRKTPRTVVITGLLSYMAAMLATNDLSLAFRVDHSNDFPIGRALDKLDWRDKPTEADVRRVAGVPLAEGTFASTDPALPKAVRESMAYWKEEKAFILTYFEKDKWKRMTTYYVMFKPDSRQRFSQVEINRAIPKEEWPNNTMKGNR